MSARRARTPNRARKGSTSPSTRILIAAILTLAVIGQRAGRAAQDPTDALPYSLSYTVTGDYAIGGVDLIPAPHGGGFQTGTIDMGTTPENAVPENAEIVAAFLYWETLADTPDQLEGVLFRDAPVTFVRVISQDLSGVYAPCWSQSGNSLNVMRADVLSLLPAQMDENGHPTGRRIVTNAALTAAGLPLHRVTLPEYGVGNHSPQSAGASLFLVYRDPTKPLRRVVVYDGMRVQARGETVVQKIRGFLQSASGASKVTQIMSRGVANPSDQTTITGAATTTATNLFAGSLSPDSDRTWANPTTTVTGSMPGADGGAYGEQLALSSRYTATTPSGVRCGRQSRSAHRLPTPTTTG